MQPNSARQQTPYFELDLTDETGANTAEYSIVTLAAVAFAGILAAVLSSGTVQGLLEGLIERALTF